MGCVSEGTTRNSRTRVKRMTCMVWVWKETVHSNATEEYVPYVKPRGLCSDKNTAPQFVSRRPCMVITGGWQQGYGMQQTCLTFIEAEVSKIWDPKHHTELVITPYGVEKSCPKTSLSPPIKSNPRYMIRSQLSLRVAHHKWPWLHHSNTNTWLLESI